MVNCAKCGKKVAFFGSISDWAGNSFCSEECKAKFKAKKKESAEEKEKTKERIMMWIFLVISAIVTYFFDKWIVVGLLRPLASWSGVNLGTGWRIAIAVFVFFATWGSMYQAYSKATFFETHKFGMKPQDDSTSKIAKLKELKDKGAISKEEFEKKKKELLERI